MFVLNRQQRGGWVETLARVSSWQSLLWPVGSGSASVLPPFHPLHRRGNHQLPVSPTLSLALSPVCSPTTLSVESQFYG